MLPNSWAIEKSHFCSAVFLRNIEKLSFWADNVCLIITGGVETEVQKVACQKLDPIVETLYVDVSLINTGPFIIAQKYYSSIGLATPRPTISNLDFSIGATIKE